MEKLITFWVTEAKKQLLKQYCEQDELKLISGASCFNSWND
ncbi:MAG TPA: hypothetical protein VK203_29055 [Nostocaceae cyanobacterium]|nr:hypothetical protein [Nostocaceae cyanobacterium]